MICTDRGIFSDPLMENGFCVVYGVVWPPFTCPTCHRAMSFVVSRHATNHCRECDEQWKIELEARRNEIERKDRKHKD